MAESGMEKLARLAQRAREDNARAAVAEAIEQRQACIAEVVATIRAWYEWMTAYSPDELDGLEQKFAEQYVDGQAEGAV